MSGPLVGVRILEFGSIGPVPFCGALLADMGADVIRIDRTESVELSFPVPQQYDFYNRNKQSIAVNLKTPEGINIVKELAKQSHIVTEGFRPGILEKLGLSPEVLLGENPALIVGRMTGWGQTGPLSSTVGHDINYLALTGALSCIGPEDGRPTPPLNLVADLGGGAMYLAVGILAALHEARISGKGQVIDAAMIDGVSNLMSAFYGFMQEGKWDDKRESNFIDGGAPYYGTYKTKDGKFLAVGAIESRFYNDLLKLLNLDPSTLPPQNDRKSWPSLRQQFEDAFLTKTRDQWCEFAKELNACVSPVLSMSEAMSHPQATARGNFQRFAGAIHPSPAPQFSRTPASLRDGAPLPGEHTIKVLNEAIVPADLIDTALTTGAIKQAKI